jgi:hypothetical protein
MEGWKSFPLNNGLLILQEPMRIDNDFFFPMGFRMRIPRPNETLKKIPSPIKLDDNPYDQWNWKTHPFPYLRHLDGALELHHCRFHPFDFNILLLHPNYFK